MTSASTEPTNPIQSIPGDSLTPGDQRVSTLVGDRLCIQCGYNLSGQPILREAHYNMLIARCPECGTVASIQEYPLLGRWAGRWAIVLAAAWFLFLLTALASTSVTIFGFNRGITQGGSTKFANWLAERQFEWSKTQAPNTQQNSVNWNYGMQSPSAYSAADPNWLATVDLAALLKQMGGWSAAVDWEILWMWISLASVLFPIGCFWAIVLLHLRRWWLALFMVLPVALALLFEMLFWAGPGDMFISLPWQPMITLAEREIGWTLAWLTLGFSMIPLVLGAVLGRSLVRGMIRLLLPPRLRGSLAMLWIVDGKSPPVPGNV